MNVKMIKTLVFLACAVPSSAQAKGRKPSIAPSKIPLSSMKPTKKRTVMPSLKQPYQGKPSQKPSNLKNLVTIFPRKTRLPTNPTKNRTLTPTTRPIITSSTPTLQITQSPESNNGRLLFSNISRRKG